MTVVEEFREHGENLEIDANMNIPKWKLTVATERAIDCVASPEEPHRQRSSSGRYSKYKNGGLSFYAKLQGSWRILISGEVSCATSLTDSTTVLRNCRTACVGSSTQPHLPYALSQFFDLSVVGN